MLIYLTDLSSQTFFNEIKMCFMLAKLPPIAYIFTIIGSLLMKTRHSVSKEVIGIQKPLAMLQSH